MRVVSSDILVPTFPAAVVEKAYSIEELTECIPLCERRRRGVFWCGRRRDVLGWLQTTATALSPTALRRRARPMGYSAAQLCDGMLGV